MRLSDIENPLKQVVSQYIKEIYAAEALPDIKVLASREYMDRFPGLVGIGPALYHVRENTIYFMEHPFAYDVAHEVHHWHQAQEIGSERYLETMKDKEIRDKYERDADNAANVNLANISYHMRRLGITVPEEAQEF